MNDPAFVSIAFDDIPCPDFADVVVVAVPPTEKPVPTDPEVWTKAVFDVRSLPLWVKSLFAARQLLVGLIGVEKGDGSVFDVDQVRGGEALVAEDDRHLDFRAGVAYDEQRRLLRVTTAVRLKGWRGRLYFLPVGILHDPITRAMARSAVRRITREAR
ncbi:MAG: DUF2867 domain-containing protein [Nocardioides sp.]